MRIYTERPDDGRRTTASRRTLAALVPLRLPVVIRESIEAYVGCISGAMMKNDYLQGIKSAGFRDVRVLGETTFPVDLITNHPTAKAIIENLKVPPEKVKRLAGSVASVKVHGVKPNEHS